MIKDVLKNNFYTFGQSFFKTFNTSFYDGAHLRAVSEIPVTGGILGDVLGAKVSYGDNCYQEALERNTGYVAKQALLPLIERYAIPKDTMIINRDAFGVVSDTGTLPYMIHGESTWYRDDQAAYYFNMKREIGRLDRSLPLNADHLVTITTIATLCLGVLTMSFLKASVLSFTIGYVANAAIRRSIEDRADDFAIKHSTDAELLGGRRYLLTHVLKELKEWEDATPTERALFFQDNGLPHFLVPTKLSPVSDRIRKIESELSRRGKSLNEAQTKQQQAEIQRLRLVRPTLLPNYLGTWFKKHAGAELKQVAECWDQIA